MDGNVALWAVGVGTGLSALGAGLGVGRATAAALEGTARQPAAAGDLRTVLVLGAGLIEGSVLFALILNLLVIYR